MTWQDALLLAGFVVTLVDLTVLVGIYLDDHAMRKLAEESIGISRESLEAQKAYLDLRRRWYESRGKKKTDDTGSAKTPQPLA